MAGGVFRRQMTMFTKPLTELEYADVEAFCTGSPLPEGPLVEYKSGFPDKLEKSIASFANTYGGVIVMGVHAPSPSNTPCLPIEGMDHDTGIEERITEICLCNIFPPVIPDVRVLKIPEKSGKCVTVVRVHDSLIGPHAIDKNSRVYVRVNSVSHPIQLADLDRVRWLHDRRERAISLRQQLHAEVEDVFAMSPKDTN
ncbi:MAG TPA: ATP-binding protein, partial [Acidobacteriota bacterium]|nr:ATP-binding protein [Acidobacteriota bacterium]